MTDMTVTEKMRKDALEIFFSGLRAVDPQEAVLRHVHVVSGDLMVGGKIYKLRDFQRIWVFGAGKADAPMAKALENLLGERISGGLIIVKEGYGLSLKRVQVVEASHPVPDERGIRGTREMMLMMEEVGEKDLVFVLISGGGSALLSAPAQDVSLEDKQEVTRLLLSCGATIHEINAVRKHISLVKGGQMARALHPATVVSLIMSDVIGDDLDVIASGPTVPDRSTFLDAKGVLETHGIWSDIPSSIKNRVELGIRGEIQDTPKPGDPVFEKCHWELVGSNIQALKAAREAAEKLGYNPLILSSRIEGEAREVGKVFGAIAMEVINSSYPIAPPACILGGGETTVTVKGDGKGGRNQELALSVAISLKGIEGVIFLSAGTDGTDGPTDAAGAIVDGFTLQRAKRIGLSAINYLQRNDSYHFFQALGDLVITGPTRTNVMDIQVLLINRR